VSVMKATLMDGRQVDYVHTNDPPAGGMKKTYFSPDRSYVVQFFHDQSAAQDPHRLTRLESILSKYNPTLPQDAGGSSGATKASADYFKGLFCWPTAIVTNPGIGIMAPVYPSDFFFASGPFKGNEKNGKWFSSPKLRKLLPEPERGPWINYLKLGILLSRAVTRLHMAGLAHSDLSCNNVLVDPTTGRVAVIDIDSLVVPGLFPPDVIGTPGYIAPEVLATQHLRMDDRNRKHACAATDQYALAVLLYEYLLYRHPLRGPKVNCTTSAEEDERMSMGEKALWIEHPKDASNRPNQIDIPYNTLGPQLASLFERAFIKGLHNPADRPGAIEWERALVKTWDLLHPCANASCPSKWFVLTDVTNPVCPFCRTRAKGTIPVVKLRKEVRAGQWMQDGQIVLYNNSTLFKWHVFDNIYPGIEADRTPQAYCVWHGGKWLLVNQNMTSLTSPGGNRVPQGQAVELVPGAQIRLAAEPHGRMAEVHVVGI
jgi:hypothetical protein